MKTFLYLFFLLLVGAALASCGGGGGSQSSTSGASAVSPASNPAATNAPSGSAAAGNSASVPQSTIPNVQPIAVNTAPGLTRNVLTTSVTVCQPGTSNCATIDNVQVDTGSHGLRILASALPSGMTLAAVDSGGNGGNGANAATISGECAVFGGGYTWGAVRSADVRMAGQLAAALPIQIIADPAVPTVPTDCAGAGPAMQTLTSLRANGILGVGLFDADCGSACVNAALPRWYYDCAANGACVASTQALAQQVTNPVSHFALDNNGVVIELPAIADAGAASVAGSLIFGIGTQANNTLDGAAVIRANSQSGYILTTSGAQSYAQSYIDSGSNGLFFRSSQLPQCGFWYCPSSTQGANASIVGTDGASATVSFEIANASALFASSNNAFDNLAGVSGTGFGWGLPFFYGRRVYTAIATRMTSAGPGPYYAF
ncbi:hypothetical protein P3T18_005233 [Paraburkholderia sp. GAS199]|uniref:DUF3443 domain-containing protein n=1 Tax=Paraburkholderia sp. GAS199 TaxID=3035126 RepID=UPI003D22B31C